MTEVATSIGKPWCIPLPKTPCLVVGEVVENIIWNTTFEQGLGWFSVNELGGEQGDIGTSHNMVQHSGGVTGVVQVFLGVYILVL